MQEKGFKLQNLLSNVFVHKYCTTKVQEEQSTAKEQLKVSD